MTALRVICLWKLSYSRGQVLANSICLGFFFFFPSGYVSLKRKKKKGKGKRLIFVGKFGALKVKQCNNLYSVFWREKKSI